MPVRPRTFAVQSFDRQPANQTRCIAQNKTDAYSMEQGLAGQFELYGHPVHRTPHRNTIDRCSEKSTASVDSVSSTNKMSGSKVLDRRSPKRDLASRTDGYSLSKS